MHRLHSTVQVLTSTAYTVRDSMRNVSSGMRCFLPLLLLLVVSAKAQDWQQIEDFPGNARDDAAAFAIGTRAYFGTGMEVGWGLTTNWWMLDIAGGQEWQAVPHLPGEARQYSSGFALNGFGYVFGGLSTNGPLNELWSFSEVDNSWTQRTHLPAQERYACSVFVIDNAVYLVGGLFADGTPSNECWRYDAALDLWTQVADLPGLGRHRASSFAIGPYGYVVGGADQAYNALAETWRYEPASDTWTQMAPLPQPRYGATAISTVAFGIVGGASDDTTFHANAFEYGALANSWTEMSEALPFGVRGISSAYAGSGAWFFNVIGTGLDNDLVRRKEMYRYGYAIGIEEQALAPFHLYPNPSNALVYLSLPDTWPGAQIMIRDALGRTVQELRVESGSACDVRHLPAGYYVVEARNGPVVLRSVLSKLP